MYDHNQSQKDIIMNTLHYIQIFADCQAIENDPKVAPSEAIHMYCNPAILWKDQQGYMTTNGSYELGIKVNRDDEIRWQVFPQVALPPHASEPYSVIISARHDWEEPTALLRDWAAHQGHQSIYVYGSDDVSMSQDADVSIKRVTGYAPYVSARATFPDRPNPGALSSTEAYKFWIDIYKGNSSTPIVKDYGWDPYVTIQEP